jgi:hypothetical protein
VISDLTVVRHLNRVEASVGELYERPPKVLTEAQVRLEVRNLLRDAKRRVDRTGNVLAT